MRTFGKDDMSLGVDVVEIPFIWIPDGYTGPRPGYPWFEAGRMTLGAQQSMAVSSPSDRARWGGGDGRSYVTLAEPLLGVSAQDALPGSGSSGMSADGVGTGFRPNEADPFSNSPAHVRTYGNSSDVAMRAAVEALGALANPGAVPAVLNGAILPSSAGSLGSPSRPSGLVWPGGDLGSVPSNGPTAIRPVSDAATDSSRDPPGRATSFGDAVVVVLPDGSSVPDRNSATGRLMSPVANLSAVAEAGRRTGQLYSMMLRVPSSSGSAMGYLGASLAANVGHGGVFDYQRQGNHITGFTQFPQYRDVSNFNVGPFCQQAGLSPEQCLAAAGGYARFFSSNAKPDQPFGLESRTAEFINLGYETGRSGVFGAPVGPR